MFLNKKREIDYSGKVGSGPKHTTGVQDKNWDRIRTQTIEKPI